MANTIGMPGLNTIFRSAALQAIERAERGNVGLIVRDAHIPDNNPSIIYEKDDIPAGLSEGTKEQIALAMKGYKLQPNKIVAYALDNEEEDYTKALDYFALKKVNYLAASSAETDGQVTAIADWAKKERAKKNKVKAVLPNANTANCEGVINYAMEKTKEDKEYTTEKYCARIAGFLAGIPQKESATFAEFADVTDCSSMTREEVVAAQNAGKFVIFYDGEKYKAAMGVNSLTTVADGQNDSWKKIRVVEIMDMIADDLNILIEDNYVGKMPNTYSNKVLLISAIEEYMKIYMENGQIESYEIALNVDAIRKYLHEKGEYKFDELRAMSDEDVKKLRTDEKVFVSMKVGIADTMEIINLDVLV